MAWALGPAFTRTWIRFTAACGREDFDAAAADCTIRGTGGIARRNTADVRLFTNAARVAKNPGAYVRSRLYFPTVLLDEVVISS